MHRRVAPSGGTEVDMMGIDRLLQSMTRVGEELGLDAERSFRPYYTCIMAYTAYMHIYVDEPSVFKWIIAKLRGLLEITPPTLEECCVCLQKCTIMSLIVCCMCTELICYSYGLIF